MKPRVYVETSVISYLTARPTDNVIAGARQQLTAQLWADLELFEAFVSDLVLDECAGGDVSAAQARLLALRDLPVLDRVDAADGLAKLLIRRAALPAKAIDDALHVAMAAVHG
jgi:hypothetical protein